MIDSFALLMVGWVGGWIYRQEASAAAQSLVQIVVENDITKARSQHPYPVGFVRREEVVTRGSIQNNSILKTVISFKRINWSYLLCNLITLFAICCAAFVASHLLYFTHTVRLESCFLFCCDGADETQIVGCFELTGAEVWQHSAFKRWSLSKLLGLIKAILLSTKRTPRWFMSKLVWR